MTGIRVREATRGDLGAIAAIARATGSGQEFAAADPAYAGFLLEHGRVVVAVRDGSVAGFGATRQTGAAGRAVTMLTDLYVEPAAHGGGAGRAILGELWGGTGARMTFSSLHSHALPLYTSFGLDAWWPLLYLKGDPGALAMPAGWQAVPASPREVGALEAGWTGADRTADHLAWAARPRGAPLLARRDGIVLAAGTAGGAGDEYGLAHLAVAPPEAGPSVAAPDSVARDAVLAVLASLDPPAGGTARAWLPAPHPAVRPLLRRGWRADGFDLFMATEPGLLDPRRAVPSPGLA